MTDRTIEWSNERGFGRQQLPSKISFHMKRKSLVAASYLQSIKTLLTVELSQYHKSGSAFPSCEPVAARSDCRRLAPQVVPERGTKSLAIDFAVKIFDYLLE